MKRFVSLFVALMIVFCLCSSAMATAMHTLLIEIDFTSGLIFASKYKVDLYINDQKIKTLEIGKSFKESIEVEEGPNTLYFYKVNDKSVNEKIELDIKESTKVSCSLSTYVEKSIDLSKIVIKAMPNAGNTGTKEELTIEDGEIVFRDIPWGSDYYVAAKAFESKRYSGGLNTRPNMYMIAGLNDLVSWFPKITTKWGHLGECAIVYNPEMQVAGYDLNEINLYFAYIADQYGDVTRELKDSALFAAVYEIKVPGEDYDKTIKDLKSKLSKNYGTDITQHEDKYTDKKATYYIWKGKKDTYVCLCDISESSWFSWNRKITIVYASKKYEKKLTETDAILSAVDKANSTPAPFERNDSDGL